jgi:hypothetical protein
VATIRPRTATGFFGPRFHGTALLAWRFWPYRPVRSGLAVERNCNVRCVCVSLNRTGGSERRSVDGSDKTATPVADSAAQTGAISHRDDSDAPVGARQRPTHPSWEWYFKILSTYVRVLITRRRKQATEKSALPNHSRTREPSIVSR